MTSRVYPTENTMDTYPLLTQVGKKGIKRKIRWSLSDLGPHFVFDFSDLGKQKLGEASIPNYEHQPKIGTFANEGALGTIYYDISMDKMGEIWMYLQKPIQHISPIFLASSPQELVGITDRFAAHLQDIEKSNQESEWEAHWRQFLDDCKNIDPKGGASYWVSLAVDYLD